MEITASQHLKHLQAFCSHELQPPPPDAGTYPVEASVVIPVKNREKTIAAALTSALEQQLRFPFNVLVVDNYSTDKTGSILAKAAQQDSRVIPLVPERTDLGIGGCWNVAVQSPLCGRYVCQLDSDDIYAHKYALATMIGLLQTGEYGMAVGAYRTVNISGDEIPPGVVDHREWTRENGRNNLLRVHGIGAPRAFPAALLRKFPLPDISYGEDYAAALRISRDFVVGRTFEPLYLCRRWHDNTEANLTPDQKNKLHYVKDRLRTKEISERQKRSMQASL